MVYDLLKKLSDAHGLSGFEGISRLLSEKSWKGM